ncbi:MAG: LptF/LptG family permease [Phycisphaerales bacterium]|nr:LptF/LptG family permease [Phycisphaerales bacterium]
MTKIDRHVGLRMLANFVLLFILLYLFAAVIDIILNLEVFSTIADKSLPEEAGTIRRILAAAGIALGYHLPQVFQFYAWLWGLLAIGAMAFTVSQMSRHRELVALLASGWNLQRVALPLIIVTAGLGGLQVINQELILPQLAPLLLRNHVQAGQPGLRSFPVPITVDSNRRLLQAGAFQPDSGQLTQPNFIERSSAGLAVRRVRADSATWDPVREGWILENGISTTLERDDGEVARAGRPTEETFVETDLSPRILLMRRHGALAGMLSTLQILDLLDGPETRESSALRRSLWSRYVAIIVNILILLVALPFFLDRLPVGLVQRTVSCAAVVLPLYVIVAATMLVPLPGISPLLGVFLPLVLLLPLGMARYGWLRT